MFIYYSIKLCLLAAYLWLVTQLISVMSHTAKTFFYGVMAATFMVICPKKLITATVDFFKYNP